MADRVLTDDELRFMRNTGQLVCQCPFPHPMPIGWGGAYQCRTCFKALRHTPQQGSSHDRY